MKMPGIIESVLSLKKVTGLVIRIADSVPVLNFCTLELKKSEVNVLKSGTDLSVEQFFSLADLAIPMALVFDGKGVVHKKISMNETDDVSSVLNKTLPNTSTDDFYVAHTAVFNSQCIATVTRRLHIDELVALFRDKKADVIDIAFGPFQVRSILELVNTGYNAELQLPYHSLLFTDGYVSELIPKANDTGVFKIGSEVISAKLIVAFAAAFTSLAGAAGDTVTNLPLAHLKTDYRQKKIFKTGLVAAAVFLFAILLINFFVFAHYNAEKQDLEARINVNQSSISQIDTLKKELAEKELIVEKTGLLQSSKTSYFADRIAATVPPSIKLTHLVVYPQEKNKAEEDETNYKFKTAQVEIRGKCRYSIDVNDWINEMRSFAWAKDIRLVHYNPSNTEKGSDFIIEITL